MNVYILLKKKKKIILERFYTRSLEKCGNSHYDDHKIID